MPEYEPGTVAVATVRGVPGVRIFRIDADPRLWVSSRCNHLRDDEVIDVRLLGVLDPEDRGRASRLAMLMQSAIDSIPYEHDDLTSEMADAGQAALREFVAPTPPKPEVYEHLAATSDGVHRAVCGKVWKVRNRDAVTVLGRCPACADAATDGWVA